MSGSKVLLAIGRPVHQKGYETTIDAMPALLQEFPGAVLLIAGKGPLEQPLRSRAERLGVQHAVRLLGRRDDVPVLLAIADVYVSSSYLEGHSIALLEGLAAGLPAVLTEIDAFTEVAAGLDSVRFFPAGDAARMAAVWVRCSRRVARYESKPLSQHARFGDASHLKPVLPVLSRWHEWRPIGESHACLPRGPAYEGVSTYYSVQS